MSPNVRKEEGADGGGGMERDEIGTGFLFNSVGRHHLFTLEIWDH